MAEIVDLNIVDASNTARMPENQAPSTVNNGVRALEGILARWHKDTNGSLVSTGSANAYVLAANRTISAYYDGLSFTFEANFANTGAATLNVDSVGAQAIVMSDGTALVSGDIPSAAKITVRYDNDNTRWLIASLLGRPRWTYTAVSTTTAGTAVDFTGIPSWATEIQLMMIGVSTNGTSRIVIQLGTSGGFVTSGYLGATATLAVSSNTASLRTEGGAVSDNTVDAALWQGKMRWDFYDANTWIADGSFARSDGIEVGIAASAIAAGGVVTQVRLTTAGGSDTFDAMGAVVRYR